MEYNSACVSLCVIEGMSVCWKSLLRIGLSEIIGI